MGPGITGRRPAFHPLGKAFDTPEVAVQRRHGLGQIRGIVFQPNAQEADIRSLLQSIQGSVSSGPSREGRYVVSVGKQSDLEKVMRTLKQSKFVLFAEPAY